MMKNNRLNRKDERGIQMNKNHEKIKQLSYEITTYRNWQQEDEIKKLLLFQKIVKVTDDTLFLDNGTELKIIGNEGCGGCSSGWYDVTELNGCDNAITDVEFDCIDNETDYGDTSFQIFVYAEDEKIKIAQIDGTDGNGCYGTGYSIQVKMKEKIKNVQAKETMAKNEYSGER